MEIYYCDSCKNKPYTTDLKRYTGCPVCSSKLIYADVNPDSLRTRPVIGQTGKTVLDPSCAMSISQTGNMFNIRSSDEFYMYMNFEKKKYETFDCRFLLGDTPDQNGVINSVPVLGPVIEFTRSVDISELEIYHECIRRYLARNGWERYPGSYYSYRTNNPGIIHQVRCSDTDMTDASGFEYNKFNSASYFIEYTNPSFADVKLSNPFRHKQDHESMSVRNVYGMKKSMFLQGMFFRSKDGYIKKELEALAGAMAVLYDSPYSNLIRYDRIMREWCSV
ncbi:MAG: hypothetical protein Q4F95_14525 [Oscillospiraceae bacterium]|nr:hypothetical protein [Oscillospiraceae bacterium]